MRRVGFGLLARRVLHEPLRMRPRI
jgi:hypothetical protein